MIAGLALAAALMGQTAQVYGPASPAPAKAPPPVKTTASECSPGIPNPNSREIVVCAPKPQGFRIDPDVLAAKKAKRRALAGRARPPESLKDRSCAVVGPAGCLFDKPGVDLLAAAVTLGKIEDRLSKGQEIGSIFVTDPQLSEYQYYQIAKKEREAKEAAAKAKVTAAKPSSSEQP
jgi:hypothetical protein